MEAKDFRIGNYLEMLFTSAIEGGKSYWAVGTVNEKDFAGIIAYPDNYKPIQLTEEWLLKFGFLKKNGVFTKSRSVELGHEFGDFSVSIYDDTQLKVWRGGKYMGIVGGCGHVHKLQNLHFALTGQEITISDNGQTPH